MKKIGWMVSLVCSTLSLAQAAVIGHDVIERSRTDGWTGFSMIDLGMRMTDEGSIASWSVYAKGTGGIHLQTYRRVSGDSYRVVGENYFAVTALGLNHYAVPDSARIEYQLGDYVGWTYDNEALLCYDFAADSSFVGWNSSGDRAVGSGSGITFDGGQARTYSISMNTTQIPEPALGWSILFITAFLYWQRMRSKNARTTSASSLAWKNKVRRA